MQKHHFITALHGVPKDATITRIKHDNRANKITVDFTRSDSTEGTIVSRFVTEKPAVTIIPKL
jgi:DNA primase